MLLAEYGGVVSVGRLADALWGERAPGGFVTTVQTYVFHLREVLEPDRRHGAPGQVLVTERGGYRLDTSGSAVDAAIFESLLSAGHRAIDRGAYEEASDQLKRALDLWRGEVLADVADLGFVTPLAARLDEMRQTARGLRIEAELALGLHADALPEIDGLVAEHPLWEQLQAQRITALYRSGRQSDALAAYRDLRNRLAEELGIEPSSPLQQLHQAVLTQAEALDWRRPTHVKPPVPESVIAPRSQELPLTTDEAPHEPSAPVLSRLRGPFRLSGRRAHLATGAVAVVLATGIAISVAHLWIQSGPPSFPANSIGSINRDGSLAGSVNVGLSPDALAYGAGSLWAANRTDSTVSRIDPDTRAVVQTIPVGASPVAITVTAHDVWVANFDDGTVSRINTVSNTVVDRIPVGVHPAAIASRPDGVWVANSDDGTIQRIDPATDQTDKAVEVGGGPDGIAIDKTSLWVCSAVDGTVVEIDPKTLQQGRSVVVGAGPRGVALTPGDVWVASQLSQSVTRINRATGAARTINVGDGPHSLVVEGDSVWVSNEYDGTISRIDPTSNEVVGTRYVGASPRGLAAAGGSIWVAAGAFADAGHRGGTLRVAAYELPGELDVDPAAVYDPYTVTAEKFVYDGLVAFGMSGGLGSESLVPDLAVALPRPSNANKTYAFTLRPGVRYSTGREVNASDFRTGLLKALTVGGNPEYYAGVIGGRNCIDHPASCDLSAGLITDNVTRSVTFNLVAPDPAFMDKLAWLVYPVPPGTPATVSKVPVPGTGPYMISAYQQGKRFTLSPNTFFWQWSFAAQPAGYPDVIRFAKVTDGKAAANEVIQGRADVVRVFPASASVRDDLAKRYPSQLKPQGRAQTVFEHLNTRMAPFNDVRARQALNYAVDRNRLVEIEGAIGRFDLTCQVLPPNFPSYRWYCPYTSGPANDGYHGPDLARANELVTLSGTRGMAVTVRGLASGAGHALNLYFATVLRDLGYRVSLQELPDDFDFLGPFGQAQITSAPGWSADFPDASQFYDNEFSCRSGVGGTGYCNPKIERVAAEAHAAGLTDPGGAARLWTEVDRMVTDDAPVVSLGNNTGVWFVSERVGDYQSNALVGPLLSQIWVK